MNNVNIIFAYIQTNKQTNTPLYNNRFAWFGVPWDIELFYNVVSRGEKLSSTVLKVFRKVLVGNSLRSRAICYRWGSLSSLTHPSFKHYEHVSTDLILAEHGSWFRGCWMLVTISVHISLQGWSLYVVLALVV